MNTYSKLAVPQNKYPHTWYYKRTLDATTDSNQCNPIINRTNSLFTIILPVDKKRITFSMTLSSGRRWAWFLLLLPSSIGFQTLFFFCLYSQEPFHDSSFFLYHTYKFSFVLFLLGSLRTSSENLVYTAALPATDEEQKTRRNRKHVGYWGKVGGGDLGKWLVIQVTECLRWWNI